MDPSLPFGIFTRKPDDAAIPGIPRDSVAIPLDSVAMAAMPAIPGFLPGFITKLPDC
jgi:hypothetical protein